MRYLLTLHSILDDSEIGGREKTVTPEFHYRDVRLQPRDLSDVTSTKALQKKQGIKSLKISWLTATCGHFCISQHPYQLLVPVLLLIPPFIKSSLSHDAGEDMFSATEKSQNRG